MPLQVSKDAAKPGRTGGAAQHLRYPVPAAEMALQPGRLVPQHQAAADCVGVVVRPPPSPVTRPQSIDPVHHFLQA